ncbi:hypothetical protein HYH03_008991 [Edaphochlamys debaryana]|uniref:Rieske domain-containing protein n=1 Tax=Edaphochlamys debaryana TaxID=47281 RepID=A0A836BYC1_9CHLO|nr:hypothetical protein HYH03_008991 [Edaphochlamys debaryana]|eukprot:KAG2492837.1 hypothetical protein HYH03_008991 [Edaphochlamys debaryana]
MTMLKAGTRFPSSRKFLWDRTALARPEVIEPKDNLPTISVPSDLRVQGQSALSAVLTCVDGRRLRIAVLGPAQTPDKAPGAELLSVPATNRPADDLSTQQDHVAGLAHIVQHSLDRKGCARLTTGLSLGLALGPLGGSSGAGGGGASGGGGRSLSATLLLPASPLSLTLLYSKRLCDVPLAQALAQCGPGAGGSAQDVQTGYLSMDQARSLLPLAADDPSIYSIPLVGVWVRGARSLEHPAVYGAALQFAFGSALPDRATQLDGAFLLLLFAGDSPIGRCYEACFAQPQNTAPGSGAGGLRLVPYTARADLVGQTSAPLELRPLLDSRLAAAAGRQLTLAPPSPLPGTAPPSASVAGLGTASGALALALPGHMHRDSAGKLHISKARKLLDGPSGAEADGGGYGGGIGLGATTPAPPGWAALQAAGYGGGGAGAAAAGFLPARDSSPPVPRTAAVPTPFRPLGDPSDAATASHLAEAAGPQDPRLQYRAGGMAMTPAPASYGGSAAVASSYGAVPVPSTSQAAASQTGAVSSHGTAVGGVMLTPAASLLRRVPDWRSGAEAPAQPSAAGAGAAQHWQGTTASQPQPDSLRQPAAPAALAGHSLMMQNPAGSAQAGGIGPSGPAAYSASGVPWAGSGLGLRPSAATEAGSGRAGASGAASPGAPASGANVHQSLDEWLQASVAAAAAATTTGASGPAPAPSGPPSGGAGQGSGWPRPPTEPRPPHSHAQAPGSQQGSRPYGPATAHPVPQDPQHPAGPHAAQDRGALGGPGGQGTPDPDQEGLPSDPQLLRAEVVFLRRQVRQLQEQVARLMVAGPQAGPSAGAGAQPPPAHQPEPQGYVEQHGACGHELPPGPEGLAPIGCPTLAPDMPELPSATAAAAMATARAAAAAAAAEDRSDRMSVSASEASEPQARSVGPMSVSSMAQAPMAASLAAGASASSPSRPPPGSTPPQPGAPRDGACGPSATLPQHSWAVGQPWSQPGAPGLAGLGSSAGVGMGTPGMGAVPGWASVLRSGSAGRGLRRARRTSTSSDEDEKDARSVASTDSDVRPVGAALRASFAAATAPQPGPAAAPASSGPQPQSEPAQGRNRPDPAGVAASAGALAAGPGALDGITGGPPPSSRAAGLGSGVDSAAGKGAHGTGAGASLAPSSQGPTSVASTSLGSSLALVRTQYVPLDDSDSSDDEMEAALMSNWTDQWYPVGFLVDLPTDVPIPFSLFDTKLVVWHLGQGRWACMADECPHRRAPLSRGRLFRPSTPPASTPSASGQAQSSDARIECAYHGWQFDSAGACVSLPQLLPQGYAAASNNGPSSTNGAGAAGSAGPGVAGAGARPLPPRSCSGRAFPTAVAQGMLWVWYGSNGGSCGAVSGVSVAAPPDEALIPLDFAEEGARRGEDWALVDVFTRDFPYDWETMVENVLDPAHVAFAHDGTGQGLDRHASPPLELQIVASGPGGFTGRFRGVRTAPPSADPPASLSTPSSPQSSSSPSAPTPSTPSSPSSSSSPPSASSSPPPPRFLPGAWSVVEFRAPCLVSMRFSLPGKGEAGLVLYCVPLGRGRSRMVARLPRNFSTGWLAGLQPRWAKHLPRMAVLDQDIDLLREQEATMARARLAALLSARGQGQGSDAQQGAAAAVAAAGWRSYVLPAPADRMVIEFRRWMDAAGGSRPWALPEGPEVLAALAAGPGRGEGGDPLRREEVLDRYHAHVRSCSACSGALRRFSALEAACRLAGLVAAAAAAGMWAAAAATGAAAAAAAAAAATAASSSPAAAASAAAAAAATTAAAGALPAAAPLLAAALAAALLAAAAWCGRMVRAFHYMEEGIHLRMNEDRWLRRLLFSGTNSFNSMVALTNKTSAPPGQAAAAAAAGAAARK